LGGGDRAQSGQAGLQTGRVDPGQGGIAGVLVAAALELGGADQPDLAGDLGGQVLDRDGAVAVPQGDRFGGGGA